MDDSLAVRRGRVLDHEPARGGVDAQRRDRARVVVERHQPSRGRLALGPRREVEVARAQGGHPRIEAIREARQQRLPVDRPAAGRLAQAGHGPRQVRREVALAPVGVDPDPDDHARVVRPETLALAQDARELAQVDGRGQACRRGLRVELADQQGVRPGDLDHEVVRPLEPDRADGQPGGVLGGVGHRQRDRRGQPPGPVGRQPGGAEAERGQERAHRAAPTTSGRGGHGPRSARRRPRGRPRARRPPASRGRRRWSTRRWRTARRGRTRRARRRSRSRPQPAAAPAASMVSGCSSSKAAWRARTASSTRSSAMIVVIRISDVEIISMLIPASASVPNMRAA